MTGSPVRRPRVVAIEVSGDILDRYREMLVDEGYAVTTLACRDASREILREIDPDLVLLDRFLGCDPSGWELLQALSLDVELQRVPVVICATDVRMSGEERATALGDGVQVLAEPFEAPDLLSALNSALTAERIPFADTGFERH